MKLQLETLTAEAFAPFGEVIEATPQQHGFSINAGTSQRFHDLARLDPGEDGHLIVSIFRAQPRSLPFAVRMLERHPKGSQAFMPLSGRPFLVVAAPASPQPDAGQMRAFLAAGHQGINFRAGVWHHPLLALQAESDFLVIDRDDPQHNCDEFILGQSWQLDLAPCTQELTC